MAAPQEYKMENESDPSPQAQDDRPLTPGSNICAPPFVSVGPSNQDDDYDDEEECCEIDEDCDTSTVPTATCHISSTTPYAPAEPSSGEEDSEEYYDTPATLRPVVRNMSHRYVATRNFDDNEPSTSRASAFWSPSPKKPRLQNTDYIEPEPEASEPNSFVTGFSTAYRQFRAQNPLPPTVPCRHSLHHAPEWRLPVSNESQGYGSQAYPRVALGRQASHSCPPAMRMMPILPRTSTPVQQNTSMSPEWAMYGGALDSNRPLANRPRFMPRVPASPTSVPLSDPSRIYRPTTYSPIQRPDFIAYNEASASTSAINPSPMWSDVALQDGTHPYTGPSSYGTVNNATLVSSGSRRTAVMQRSVSTFTETEISTTASVINPSPNSALQDVALPACARLSGTNTGSFSPAARFATVSQTHPNVPPGTPTPQFSQITHSYRFVRSTAGHQAGSNVGESSYNNPHHPSCSSFIQLNIHHSSTTGVSNPPSMERSLPPGASSSGLAQHPLGLPQTQGSGRICRSIPISGPQPTLNVSNMEDLVDSFTQMADAVSSALRLLPQGAYGFPPQAPSRQPRGD